MKYEHEYVNKKWKINIIIIQGHIYQDSWCILPITKHPVMFQGFNDANCPYQVQTITFWKSDTESFYCDMKPLCEKVMP